MIQALAMPTSGAHECICRNPGEDDGDYTCPVHHDCFAGNCTHLDFIDEDQDNINADCGE